MTRTNQNNKVALNYAPKYPEITFVKNTGQNRQLLKIHRR